MFKHLFFDDQRLYIRQGLRREYGVPREVGTYADPNLTSPYGWCHAATGPDGCVYLLYNGIAKTREGKCVHGFGVAVSSDGVQFEPRETLSECMFVNPLVPNQILEPSDTFSEIAALAEDADAPSSERYKMLFAHVLADHIEDEIHVSADLIHWRRLSGCTWNPQGTEPITGAFFNSVSGKFTVLSRPGWGQRRVGITETSDWRYFTPLEMCLQCDSLDEPLAEIYGMPAMAYDGWFIGFPLVYSGFEQTLATKYKTGRMCAQLAYSLNGRHWQRSLRVPFIGEEMLADGPWKMTFPSSMLRQKDGSVLLYVNASRHEHGTDYAKMVGNAFVKILRLRRDGFIRLATQEREPGVVALRETLWQGGPLSINLEARHATCAIYKYDSAGKEAWLSHEDCQPFSGDSTCWIPQWNHGATDDLTGKLVNIEIRLSDGCLYSISYEGIPLMNQESEQYRRTGITPRLVPGF